MRITLPKIPHEKTNLRKAAPYSFIRKPETIIGIRHKIVCTAKSCRSVILNETNLRTGFMVIKFVTEENYHKLFICQKINPHILWIVIP